MQTLNLAVIFGWSLYLSNPIISHPSLACKKSTAQNTLALLNVQHKIWVVAVKETGLKMTVILLLEDTAPRRDNFYSSSCRGLWPSAEVFFALQTNIFFEKNHIEEEKNWEAKMLRQKVSKETVDIFLSYRMFFFFM